MSAAVASFGVASRGLIEAEEVVVALPAAVVNVNVKHAEGDLEVLQGHEENTIVERAIYAYFSAKSIGPSGVSVRPVALVLFIAPRVPQFDKLLSTRKSG